MLSQALLFMLVNVGFTHSENKVTVDFLIPEVFQPFICISSFKVVPHFHIESEWKPFLPQKDSFTRQQQENHRCE